MRANAWLLPDTPLYTVRQTQHKGKAVFATQDIDAGQLLLQTTPGISPVSHVILRPYKRETCAYCFAYDRGREWKLRLVNAGVVFCSEGCQTVWKDEAGTLGIKAHELVERWIKQQQRRHGSSTAEGTDSDTDMGGLTENGGQQSNVKLHLHRINAVWQEAVQQGRSIISARSDSQPSKIARRALREALEAEVDTDVPFYLLSGVLTAHHTAQKQDLPPASVKELIPSLVGLVEDVDVFSRRETLFGYVKGYLLLLSVLPMELLPFVQPDLCRELASRASHNAFAIRPTADGEHSGEFLGWGVWAEAAINNHSCDPNIRKQRRGRIWYFSAADSSHAPPIHEGDELCITYLGGDERELNVVERRRRLRGEWGFECCCDRCVEESRAF